MMRRLLATLPSFLLYLLFLAHGAIAKERRPILKLSANPSAIVAEEIALEQAANSKGMAKALRDFAAPDAIMFVPEPTSILSYLKSNPLLPAPDTDVHKIIMSCDGKTGVATGAWTNKGAAGYFTNVWRRYERPDGNGKWLLVFIHNDKLQVPRPKPDYIATQTASCKGNASVLLTAPADGVQLKKSLSSDQSLSWTWQYRPNKSRELEVAIWDGKVMTEVLDDEVAAPLIPEPKK